MHHPIIDTTLFVQNREALKQSLKPNALAIVTANDVMPINADANFPFRQNNDLFYLSGIAQEETILILYPHAREKRWREVLLIKETNEQIATWEGAKYSKEEAQRRSGIVTVHWVQEFESILKDLMKEVDFVYLNSNEHQRGKISFPTREVRLIQWCKEHYPLHSYQRLAPIISRLRMTKSDIEVNLIRKACDITNQGFRTVLPLIKPGIMEYELHATYAYEFIRRQADFAYEPIIASGSNACVLHYIDNNQTCHAGEMLLMDVGARYGHYNADMTRTVPVDGYFSQRQKEVYRAVLRVMRGAMELITPDHNLVTLQQEVALMMEDALLDLGLISQADIRNQDPSQPAYKRYFVHGVSHHLGLDVHDGGDRHQKFVPGMVITVEPGIYIKEENLGIRLENDVLITEQGTEDLMAHIPIEPEEIEDLMQGS